MKYASYSIQRSRPSEAIELQKRIEEEPNLLSEVFIFICFISPSWRMSARFLKPDNFLPNLYLLIIEYTKYRNLSLQDIFRQKS